MHPDGLATVSWVYFDLDLLEISAYKPLTHFLNPFSKSIKDTPKLTSDLWFVSIVPHLVNKIGYNRPCRPTRVSHTSDVVQIEH